MSLSSSIRRRLISSAIMSKNKKNSSNSNYDKLMTGVTREQGFKFTKKLTQLGKDRKYLDILHLAFGPVRSKILSNKQYENVKRVSKEMRNRPNSKIKPSFPKYAMVRPEVWNVVIQNLSKEGLMDESFSIFTKMRERGVQITPETVTSLLSSCTNYIRKVERTRKEAHFSGNNNKKISYHKSSNALKAASVSSDNETTNNDDHKELESKSSVNCTEQNRAFFKALKLFYRLKTPTTSSPNSSIELSTVHYNALLMVCARANQWNAMFQLYNSMIGRTQMKELKQMTDLTLEDYFSQCKRDKKAAAASGTGERNSAGLDRLMEGTVIKGGEDGSLDDGINIDDLFADTSDKSSEDRMEGSLGLKSVEDALALLEKGMKGDLISRPVFRDKITYSTVLNACANRKGDAAFSDAQVIWRELLTDIEESRALELERSRKESEMVSEQDLMAKNKQRRQKCEEIQLSEEEYEKWLQIERLKDKMVFEKPTVKIDTGLVNSFLMACKNADRKSNVSQALVTSFKYFGTSLNWMDFQVYVKENYPVAKFEKIRAISQASGISKLSREEPVEFPKCLPNSKSLDILMNILYKKLNIDADLVCAFYRFYTELKPKHLRVAVDEPLKLFYQKLSQPHSGYDSKSIRTLSKETGKVAKANFNIKKNTNNNQKNHQKKPSESQTRSRAAPSNDN